MTQTMIDFNTAKLSGKLKLLLSLLRVRPLTSVEIRETLNTCCPGTDIADLRKKGLKIKCEYIGMSLNKKKVFLYTLDKEALPCI